MAVEAYSADVVVVGAGAGGLAAAITLARAGRTVAVVEAGPHLSPGELPDRFVDALRDLYDGWQTTLTRGPALWPVVQGRAVGGTTVINSAITVRTPADVVDLWARDHGLDPTRYRRALERHQDDLERELRARPVGGPDLGRHNTLAIEGATRLGLHDHDMVRYVDGCEGRGRCMLGCRAGRKVSADRAWVPELLDRGGLLLPEAPVDRIRFEQGRAVAVEGHRVDTRTRTRRAPFVVHARDAVMVAASATHTPLLLRRSGLRHRALGRGFRSHPGAGVLGLYDTPVQQDHGATQGWSTLALRERGLKLETLSFPLEMLVARLPGAGTALTRRLAESAHVSHVALGLRAEATGRVSAGMGGRPRVRYRLTRRDLHRLREGLHACARVHVAAGAHTVLPGIAGLPTALPADEIDAILDAPLRSTAYVCILSHLFGGAAMGADPGRTVCDADGRVRGTSNVWVGCAAAIPTTLGVNPQHTIMALARMRAESMVEARAPKGP